MGHSVENGDKSRNGNKLETYFMEKTGLKKFTKKQKPSFINSHNNKQIIDFDFYTKIDGVDVYIDLTTTYRSDRLKQKAYNALMYKNNFNTPCKFYMVVGKLIEDGKKKNPILVEGIYGVILVDYLINMIK
jgi:hypothetical protein